MNNDDSKIIINNNNNMPDMAKKEHKLALATNNVEIFNEQNQI